MTYDRDDHANREGVPVTDLSPPLLDPDPLYVESDDLWDPQLGAWVPRPSALWALLVGIVSGGVAGIVLGLILASQVSAASPAAVEPFPVARPQPEAPQTTGVSPLRSPSSTNGTGAASVAASPDPRTPPEATRSGTASWYAAPGLIAAAGPGLRHGAWRGSLVVVISGGRSVTVRLSDWCQCFRGTSRERLIDLSDDAFARLAPLSRGLIAVTVAPAGPTTTVPPTDAEAEEPDR